MKEGNFTTDFSPDLELEKTYYGEIAQQITPGLNIYYERMTQTRFLWWTTYYPGKEKLTQTTFPPPPSGCSIISRGHSAGDFPGLVVNTF